MRRASSSNCKGRAKSPLSATASWLPCWRWGKRASVNCSRHNRRRWREIEILSMTAATSLFLLRHAEVETRYHRTFGGQIDMDISDRGREQAGMLAKYLKHKSFSVIYASPMQRVQKTLAPLLAGRDSALVVMPGLREVDFGDWTGMSWEEVQTRHNVS